MSKKSKKVKFNSYEKQLINDYEVALHSPIEGSVFTIERIQKEVEASNNTSLKIAVKKVHMDFNQIVVDEYKVKSSKLPEGEYLPEGDWDAIRAHQQMIFSLGAAIYRLDGSIPPLSVTNPLVEEASDLACDLPMVDEVTLIRGVRGSYDGGFGKHEFFPMHVLELACIDESGKRATICLTRDCVQLLYNFFKCNDLK